MTHFEYDITDFGTISGNFPTSPYDERQSVLLYLEDKLANGYEFVCLSDNGGGTLRFFFKVVAK